MKRLFNLSLFALLLSGMAANAQQYLYVFYPGGTNSLTCSSPTLQLQAWSYSSNTPLSYTWSMPSSTVTVNSASLTVSSPGIYTVSAITGSVTTSQTISIGVNTVAPVSAMSAMQLATNCTVSALPANTLAATSPTFNVTHYVYAPSGAVYAAGSYTTIYSANAPGTYTYVLVNNSNGCSTTSTFNIVGSGFPSFGLNSIAPGYTLGCNSKSITSVNIVNASTQPIQGGPVSYTFLAPSSPTTLPGGPLSPVSTATANTPGTWMAITRDNSSQCTTRIPFTILSNTTAPKLDTVLTNGNVLSCNKTGVSMQVIRTSSNISYSWSWPQQSNFVSDTLSAHPNYSTPNGTLAGVYTITATDNNSTCKSTVMLTIFQFIMPPNAAISTGNNFALTCLTPTIVLTNVSTTSIPPASFFPNNQPVVATLWSGPSPQVPATFTSTYIAATAGVYTMNAKDQNNGCTAAATVVISDNRIMPAASAAGPFLLPCPGGTVDIAPTISSTAGLAYSWQLPPSATASILNNSVVTANAPGNFTVTITNTLSGCSTTVQIGVWACVGISGNSAALSTVKLFPNPGNGIYTLDYSGDLEGLQFEAYDNAGKLVASQPLVKGNNTIYMEHVAPGLYMVQLKAGNRSLGHAKLIRQ